MAKIIRVTASDLERLRALVDQNQAGRDAALADALDAELDRAVQVSDDEVPPDVVTMNSRVVFQEVGSGVRREVVLVYPSHADVREGRLSVLAPIGAALIGLSTGQEIDWTLPDGREVVLRILSVEQPPRAHAAATVA